MMAAELVTGPVSWAAALVTSTLASISPTQIKHALDLASTSDAYAHLAHADQGTAYNGNSILSSFYGMAADFEAVKTMPLPGISQIISVFEDSATNGRRNDAHQAVIDAAGQDWNSGVDMGAPLKSLGRYSDPILGWYDDYLEHLQLADVGHHNGLTGFLAQQGEALGATRSVALQTMWTPDTVRNLWEFSRTGLEAPSSLTSLIDVRGACWRLRSAGLSETR